MLYDIRDHSLLTPDAKVMAQNEEALEGHALVAEMLLGLARPARWTGEDAEMAALAVVRQINLQVTLEPDAAVAASWSNGERSVNYRDAVREVDSVAVRLVGALPAHGRMKAKELYSGWATVRTARPTSGSWVWNSWDNPGDTYR